MLHFRKLLQFEATLYFAPVSNVALLKSLLQFVPCQNHYFNNDGCQIQFESLGLTAINKPKLLLLLTDLLKLSEIYQKYAKGERNYKKNEKN